MKAEAFLDDVERQSAEDFLGDVEAESPIPEPAPKRLTAQEMGQMLRPSEQDLAVNPFVLPKVPTPSESFNPIVPIPKIQSEKHPLAAALLNTASGFAEFAESPYGIITAPVAGGAVGSAAQRLMLGAFAADMAKNVPESFKAAEEANATGTPQEKYEANIGLGVNVAMPLALAAHAVRPKVAPEVKAKEQALEKWPEDIENAPVTNRSIDDLAVEALTPKPEPKPVPAIEFLEEGPTRIVEGQKPKRNQPVVVPDTQDLINKIIEAKADTKEKVRALFPELKLTRQEAAKLREVAFPTEPEVLKPAGEQTVPPVAEKPVEPVTAPPVEPKVEKPVETPVTPPAETPAQPAPAKPATPTDAVIQKAHDYALDKFREYLGPTGDLLPDAKAILKSIASKIVQDKGPLTAEEIKALNDIAPLGSPGRLNYDAILARLKGKPSVESPVSPIAETPQKTTAEAALEVSKEADKGTGPVAGLTPSNPFTPKEVLQDIPITEADLKSADAKVEARWQAAKLAKKSIFDKAKEALVNTKNAFTRHRPKLDPKTDAAEINILRVHEVVPHYAKSEAANVIRGITAGLGPRKYDLFSRIVILRDLVKYSERLLAESKDLPFGYQNIDAIKNDLGRFERLSGRFQDVGEALAKRDRFFEAMRNELVKRELLPNKVKDYREYFHHQVLEHMAMKEATPGTGSPDVRTHTKGWQRRRTGTAKDFNTSYLESEFEVISQSIAQMATQDTLARLEKVADIKPKLEAAAKAAGRDWETMIPKDYTIWQPERGNHFFWANTLTEKALEKFLKGEKLLTEEDFREVLAMGGKRKQWVIPKRLAETLDNFVPGKDHTAEKFIGAGMAKWKQWTLFNPMRNIVYELNNLSGDADISFAVDPGIFKNAPLAATELRKNILQKKAPTEEINFLIRQGVIDSGFSVQELPDLKGQQFFRVISGESPNLIKRYWDTVLDFNRWREGVLRYAAYKRALERLDSGEKIYWTSKRAEIDGMRKDPNVTNKEIAAKLAREAIGDYGNISYAGQWIRSKLIPFYSWMEINAPRYVRLFQNAPYEGGSRARVAATTGKRTAMLGAKVAAFYTLANLWNKTFFPEEEEELGYARNQMHLILGKGEDGTIRTMRLQGAFSDALDWFGAGDVWQDVEDVAEGRASVKDVAIESGKAPVNRVVNAATPMWKTVAEFAMNRQLYPDAFNPRPIRDRAGHVARTFSMGTIYDYLTSKPQRPGTWNALSLATYATDPGEAAYMTSRQMVSDWLKEHNTESPSLTPTEKSNALYYYKQALKYKNEKLAEHWKEQYLKLGGKSEGLKQSITKSDPLEALPKNKRGAFRESLSPAEKEILEKAREWYRRTYSR